MEPGRRRYSASSPVPSVPDVGRRAQAMMLNSVVFPAPLGPINPQICPSSVSKLTSFKAARPEKYLVNPSTRRIGATLPSRMSGEPTQLSQQSDDSSRLKKNDED